MQQSSSTVLIYYNDGTGNFTSPPSVIASYMFLPPAFAIDDIDGDGKTDIIFAEPGIGARVLWLRNEGGGNFSQAFFISLVSGDINQIETGHFNNDNNVDMILSSDGPSVNEILYIQGDGVGGTSAVSVITNVSLPRGVTSGDYNNDGNLDFAYLTASSGKIEWYSNDGNGNFSFGGLVISQNSLTSLDSGDVNDDGIDDIVFTSTTSDEVTLAINENTGTSFSTQTVSDGSQNPALVILADMDNDSDLDPVSLAYDHSKTVFHENQGEVNDIDGDGIMDDQDNCPDDANAGQEDLDNDGIGDICDPDIDGDTILNEQDNCEMQANEEQEDFDNDNIGDACDSDIDGDGIFNENDSCPFTPLGTTVNSEGCESLSTDDISKNEFSLYPNPTNGILHIEHPANGILHSIKVYDLKGSLLIQQQSSIVDLKSLTAGIYLIHIHTGSNKIVKKVIKE